VVWTNLHGGFFVGIFILACHCAGEAVDWFVNRDAGQGRAALRRAAKYAGAMLACGLASLLNPYTYHLHFFIAKYLNAPFLNVIGEFMSADFRAPRAWNFELLLFVAVGSIGWALTRQRYAQAILIAAWAHFAVFAVRNVPVFSIIAAPIAAQSVYEASVYMKELRLSERVRRMLRSFTEVGMDCAEMDSAWRVHLISCGVFALIAFAMIGMGSAPSFTAAFDNEHFPVAAASALQQRGPGKTFTSDQWADYLIYRFYPTMRVYMDGRSDFYGNDFVNEYRNVLTGADGWEKPLEQHGVTTVLLSVNDSLTAVLKASSKWQVVYDDHKAIIFEKVSPSAGQQASTAQSVRLDRDPWITAIEVRGLKATVTVNRGLRASNKSL
jgi:hypothetical protein